MCSYSKTNPTAGLQLNYVLCILVLKTFTLHSYIKITVQCIFYSKNISNLIHLQCIAQLKLFIYCETKSLKMHSYCKRIY